MTRNLSVALCNRKGWDLNLDLPSECRQELEFWLKSLHSLPNVKLTPISEIPEKIMFSDASSYAAAGFTLERNTKIVHYMWKDDEKNKSSTWRELKTIFLVLKGLGSDLSGKLVKIYTDNQNVVRIACKGSMKMELHQLSLEVLGFCVAHSIRLELAWIPRDLNAYADELSKIFDFDDWEVFLRFSELSKLKVKNISFHELHMSVHIEGSKTDVYRRGNNVLIARTSKDTCPVYWLKLYLDLAGISKSPEDFIFRSIRYFKSSDSYKLCSCNRPISYTRARELLRDALASVGLDTKCFGLHSLRSGGATSAAENNVSDRLLKLHGRWKSDLSRDNYIKDSTSNQLSVTKKLNI
ncbi:hypothetical protein FSP39_017996 [Pinctada imbricata]|uniref:Tyr recombinase domain-containing protein n=1 Tax=Pinctada imbricata TaxID=66713 RepID=A0AA88XRY6_PINIB|nr:hypothetical protein FSP39_017996 [Pinctada imbricata]